MSEHNVPSLNPRDVVLTLYSSRDQIELGEPWEALLRIENLSTIPIWIVSTTTTLTLPAEVRHPSELNISSAGAQLPSIPGPGLDSIKIPPGSHCIAQWRMNNNTTKMKEPKLWSRLQWHIFFHPGDYLIEAHVQLWRQRPDLSALSRPMIDAPDDATSPFAKAVMEPKLEQARTLDESRPMSARGTVTVVTRSLTVFSAAAFGGVAAFALRGLQLLWDESGNLAAADIYLLPTYVLTAIIVTLMVSRVSEARFPLTIRVMDFWGATALGILSAFGGHAILARIVAALG